MNLYFVKATYTNNVYKLSDFYTGDNYIQNAMKMLSMVFKGDDGVSSLIVPNKLPDNTDIRNYTHIIVPELGKIYRIIACDYWNTDQYQLTLDDDPLIANYVELKSKNIILNRTNDTTLFKGVHDVSEIIMKKKTTIERNISANPKTYLGAWALLFFQKDVGSFDMVFDGLTLDSAEVFTTIDDVITKYPEVTTYQPDSYDYFLKEVYVTSPGLQQYQAVYVGSPSFGIKWVKTTNYISKTLSIPSNTSSYKSNFSDINTLVIALPIRREITYTSGGTTSILLPFQDLVSVSKPDFLIDIKIVNDLFLPINSITCTYNNTTREATTSFVTSQGLLRNTVIATKNYGVIQFMNVNKTIDLSRTPSTLTPLNMPPFRKWYISVFGERFIVNERYHDKLKLYCNVTNGTVNYVLYYDNKNNIIASGSFTHQAKWQIDKLDQFYALNPTYKEQFYLKMAVDSMKTIAAGAIGGSAIPGIGTALGAASGLGGAILDAGLSQVNLNIQEKSLRLQPDQINGNNSDISTQLANIFGIFWILEEPENTLDGLTQMKNEYFLRGFPTSYVTNINTLVASSNDIFGSCKLVYGEIKEVVKNEYVTGYINAKLQNGVIFI